MLPNKLLFLWQISVSSKITRTNLSLEFTRSKIPPIYSTCNLWYFTRAHTHIGYKMQSQFKRSSFIVVWNSHSFAMHIDVTNQNMFSNVSCSTYKSRKRNKTHPFATTSPSELMIPYTNCFNTYNINHQMVGWLARLLESTCSIHTTGGGIHYFILVALIRSRKVRSWANAENEWNKNATLVLCTWSYECELLNERNMFWPKRKAVGKLRSPEYMRTIRKTQCYINTQRRMDSLSTPLWKWIGFLWLICCFMQVNRFVGGGDDTVRITCIER